MGGLIDAAALTALIVLTLVCAWILDAWMRGSRRRSRCPVCQGGDRRRAFRERGFRDWCDAHKDTWFDVASVWGDRA